MWTHYGYSIAHLTYVINVGGDKIVLNVCGILEIEYQSYYLCRVRVCQVVIKEEDDLHSLTNVLIR